MILSEELYRMKYLFSHERGVIVSEQKKKVKTDFDWDGKSKGDVDLNNPYGNIATNVKYKGQTYTLTTMTKAVRLSSKGESETFITPPITDVIPTLTNLELKGSAFPYPDNMVEPKFNDYPDAKIAYDSFITSIVDFLKVAGLDKLPTLSVQGTADSARPTLSIPAGYNALDHPGGTPYNGETDPTKMNQYLADTRAKVLGEKIVADILEKTGNDIKGKVKTETGVNYYGQTGKRGSEFRKVTVSPSSKSVQVDLPDTKISIDGDKTSSSSVEKPKETDTYLDLTKFGGGMIPAKNLANANTAILTSDVASPDILPDYSGGQLNGDSTPSASINGDELIVGGISFGNFKDATEPGAYESKAEYTTKYVTGGRPVTTAARDEYYYIKELQFALTTITRER